MYTCVNLISTKPQGLTSGDDFCVSPQVGSTDVYSDVHEGLTSQENVKSSPQVKPQRESRPRANWGAALCISGQSNGSAAFILGGGGVGVPLPRDIPICDARHWITSFHCTDWHVVALSCLGGLPVGETEPQPLHLLMVQTTQAPDNGFEAKTRTAYTPLWHTCGVGY